MILYGFRTTFNNIRRKLPAFSALYIVFTMLIYASLHHFFSTFHQKITGSTQTPYWLYFLCVVFLSIMCAHISLAGTLFSKLVYVLYFMTFIQLYKMICSPLYLQAEIMNPLFYKILDFTTGVLLYILLFLLSKLFRKIKLSTPLLPIAF